MTSMTRDEILQGIVIGHALRDSKLFVEEFGEPLDSASTDWDAMAWGEVVRDLKRADWKDEDIEPMWDLYRARLVEETRRLATA